MLLESSEHKKAEEELKKSELMLRNQKLALEQKNLALKEMIEHIERTKNRVKEDRLINRIDNIRFFYSSAPKSHNIDAADVVRPLIINFR